MSPLEGHASDPTKLDRAEALRKAKANTLPRVREAAGKWQAGLAALLAVVSGLSIASLGDDIRELKTNPARWAAGLVAVSLALAVAATLRALRASGGMPRLVKATDFLAGDIDHDDAAKAASDLQWAIRLTLVAIATYGAAVAVTWFGDRDASGPTHVVIDDSVDLDTP